MKRVKLRECGEPLVDVLALCPKIIFDPRVKNCSPTAYLRKSVADMLIAAQEKYLPEGVHFVILDAWRPVSIQKGYRKMFAKQFRRQHPDWDNRRVRLEVNKYAAPPTGLFASGHLCGASVDLRLMKNGRLLPMASSKYSYQHNALSDQKELPKYILKNRTMLARACKKAGLTNYPEEYWHWCYGDYLWAKLNKRAKAVYGVVSEDAIKVRQ
jgi:D-alanyl-D-alanine dipeptidase